MPPPAGLASDRASLHTSASTKTPHLQMHPLGMDDRRSSASSVSASLASPTTPGARRRNHNAKLLNQGLLRFQDVFWGTGENPTEGVTALHDVFSRHLAEAEELIAIVKARVEIEEFSASRFADIARAMTAGNGSSPVTGSGALSASSMLMAGAVSASASASSLLFGSSSLVGGIAGRLRAQSTVVAGSNGIGSTFNALREWVSPSSTPAAGGGSKEASNLMIGGGGVASSDFGSIPEGQRSLNSQTMECAPPVEVEFEAPETPAAAKAGDSVLSKDAAETNDGAKSDAEEKILRAQMMAMAACHRRHADTLTLAVLSPLSAFVDQHRRALSKKKSEVDSTYRELQRIAADIDARKELYLTKARVAEEEEYRFKKDAEMPRPNPLAPINFGSRSVGAQEFHDIVNALKKDVRIRSILTPVGLFEGCFLGEDGLKCLQAKFPKVPRSDVRRLCQELLNRRAIAPVVGGREGKFSTALPYMFGRALLKSGEPPHVKARKDAEVARLEYQAIIDSAEHTRGALEFHITDYLVAAQEAEIYRLCVAKEALTALESAQIVAANGVGACWSSPTSTGDGVVPSVLSTSSTLLTPETGGDVTSTDDAFTLTGLLVSPNPSEGVQGIASRHRTGHLRLAPFVFESYEEGRTPRQVFGIGMEELAKYTGRDVPSVVIKCVGCLLDSVRGGRSSIDTWIAPNPDLTAVQFLRHEMNKVEGGGVKSASLKRHPPAVIAGVLRLYLVEAPVSLCSYELYEPLKMLYADDYENFDMEVRLKSVQSLLATLSPPHYETLRILMAYLHELVTPLDPLDERIPRLCWSLAPTILRPKQESKETLADEHPWKFTRDLIKYQPDLIGQVDLDAATSLPRTPSPPLDQEEDATDGAETAVPPKRWTVSGKKRSRAASLLDLRNEGAANLAAAAAAAAAAGGGAGGGAPSSPSVMSPLSSPLALSPITPGSIAEEPSVIEEEDETPSSTAPTTPTTPTKSSGGWFSWGSSAQPANVGSVTKPATATASPLAKKASRQSLLGSIASKASSVMTAKPAAEPLDAKPDPLAVTSAPLEVEASKNPTASVGRRLDDVVNKRVSTAGEVPVEKKNEEVPPPSPPLTPPRSDATLEVAVDVVTASVDEATVSIDKELAEKEVEIASATPVGPSSTEMKVSAPPTPNLEATEPEKPAPMTRPHRSSTTVGSIASIASSVMFGTAAAVAATLSKSAPAPPPAAAAAAEALTPVEESAHSHHEEEEEEDMEEEEAALWAQAEMADEEEVEFFDGNEVEVESDGGAMEYTFPSHAQELDEYLQWG
ncbi:hypothetical protein HDU67_008864 [Dinochytrium kinnereticum]|nr:hypothetical protein HDU67_008864 [Dinochytrium kinnereticum]